MAAARVTGGPDEAAAKSSERTVRANTHTSGQAKNAKHESAQLFYLKWFNFPCPDFASE
jgi:hypothetical protein